MGGSMKQEQDDSSIFAPPQASDEEEERSPLRQTDSRDSVESDDDNDNDRLRQGDIRRTDFRKAQPPRSQNTRSRGNTGNNFSLREKKATRSSQAEEPSSSAGSKRSADEANGARTSHLVDANGFTKVSQKSKRKPTAGYGKSSQPKSSQPRSSQAGPRASQRSLASESDVYSPPRKKSMKSVDISPEQVSPARPGFRVPLMGSSPVSVTKAGRFRSVRASPDKSPSKPSMKLYADDNDDHRPPRAKAARQRKGRRGSPEPILEEPTQRLSFKIPDLDELSHVTGHDGDVVSLSPDARQDDTDLEEIQAISRSRCPICREVVDGELFRKHSSRLKMGIKKQTEFCRLHKRKAALETGTQKGYPEINWEGLEDRCSRHQDLLRGILEGTRPSHYGQVLKEKVQSGKNRTLLSSGDNFTPGYYGPRGLRVMTDYIMRTLSSVVRKRAVEDRLISARGYTGFVQVVLVPELTARLIMEDMGIGEEAARTVIEESAEVGELLHEENGDVVVDAGEGQEDGEAEVVEVEDDEDDNF
ncbi:hypothetical protein GGR56DRAFT_241056 [Xylariaceae sp. FL0804]|nr:hypothetical protein GGR56DRAFT_241056 [Xylariaceae sp. FL0804]